MLTEIPPRLSCVQMFVVNPPVILDRYEITSNFESL